MTGPEGQVEWGWGEQRSPEHAKESSRLSSITTCFFVFLPATPSWPQLVEGNFALFCTYTLGFRNEFQNLLLAIMVRVGPQGWLKGLRL